METLIIKEHMWLHNFKDFVLFYPAHKECFINIDPHALIVLIILLCEGAFLAVTIEMRRIRLYAGSSLSNSSSIF